jgi:CysZ protein
MRNTPTSGFGYLLKGFKMLNQKGLKRYVYIPLAINIVIYIFAIYSCGHYFAEFIGWLDGMLPSWLQWLGWILWPLFVVASGLLILYTFTLVANLVGAPFNSFLSEKVELLVTGKKLKDEGVLGALKDIPRTLKRQLAIILYYLPRFIVLLVLLLIPALNVIGSVLWFVFGCWVMAMQYIDYPMDNHKVDFKDMRLAMRKLNFKYMGFGLAVTIGMLIPIVNLFVMPAAVIGATLFYLDQQS